MKNILGIIPARYASTRFHGKPLVMIGHKSMIQRVYEQSCKALENVVVATDSQQIENHVQSFSGNVVMTSESHKTGTDRCLEAAEKFLNLKKNLNISAIINIQGDEPFINPEQITALAKCFQKGDTEIATIIKEENNIENLKNPNIVKVIIKNNNEAIYFSRTLIPYLRDCDINDWTKKHVFYKHVGIYGYRIDILKLITNLKSGLLETAESLEQNRWLENNFKINTIVTTLENKGIDTPEDLFQILNSKNIELL